MQNRIDSENAPSEERLAIVEEWIGKISGKGIVEAIDPQLVRGVLVEFGANFEVSEEAAASLRKFKNTERSLGMDSVWSHDRVKEYRIWLKHYLEEYERRTVRTLPVLDGTDIKTSGGLKFFTDLTAFAGGFMSFEKYKKITERRAEKGRLWQEKNPNDPIVLSAYSSFPPGFPAVAWEKIKSLKLF